jgi:hypothetical protein
METIIIVIELIIRIILGFIGKSIGKKRVIGSTIGFVLGFLLGLIGLLIAVCFKKKPQPQIAATTMTNPQVTATVPLQKQSYNNLYMKISLVVRVALSRKFSTMNSMTNQYCMP